MKCRVGVHPSTREPGIRPDAYDPELDAGFTPPREQDLTRPASARPLEVAASGRHWFPDLDRGQLIRFFTLTPADVAFIDPGRGRVRPSGWTWRSSCAPFRGRGHAVAATSRTSHRITDALAVGLDPGPKRSAMARALAAVSHMVSDRPLPPAPPVSQTPDRNPVAP